MGAPALAAATAALRGSHPQAKAERAAAVPRKDGDSPRTCQGTRDSGGFEGAVSRATCLVTANPGATRRR